MQITNWVFILFLPFVSRYHVYSGLRIRSDLICLQYTPFPHSGHCFYSQKNTASPEKQKLFFHSLPAVSVSKSKYFTRFSPEISAPFSGSSRKIPLCFLYTIHRNPYIFLSAAYIMFNFAPVSPESGNRESKHFPCGKNSDFHVRYF